MTERRFEDTAILVTGAASGIGREIAAALTDRGANVLASDRTDTDLRVPEQIDALATTAFDRFGKLDGLVNCAGIYPVTPFLDMSVEEWDAVLETNLRAPFLLTQAVARRMVEAGTGGSIVNISSTASTLARPGVAHYGASKAGLNQLTRVLAVELAPHDIRVNAVLPGVIGTERVLDAMADPAVRQENDAKLARIPLGRLGEPRELIPLTLFLLSADSSYCTGGLYTVDGGFTLGMPGYGS
ncbi:MAG: SDR family oxidoreductase [Minwuiales bacterium]|nr:SDR family oxidoreductase [Minwuiales bacterium]